MVKEVFRMHPIGPFEVLRMNIVPAQVAAYDIPMFMYIMISNTELGIYSDIWLDNAKEFKSERWDGTLPLQDPQLCINPFGVGWHSCAGDALGSTLILLSVATLVQRFHRAPSHGKDVDMCISFAGLMPMQLCLSPSLPLPLLARLDQSITVECSRTNSSPNLELISESHYSWNSKTTNFTI